MEPVNYIAVIFWAAAIGLPLLLFRRHITIIVIPPVIVGLLYFILHSITPAVRP